MAKDVSRGEIWLYRFGTPDKRRPVLVITRQVLLRVLETTTVVPITSTSHGSSIEVELGVEDGLKTGSWANLANVQTVRRRDLVRFVGTIRGHKMLEVCRALATATGCD
jgi:mRNA interferase MazF